MDPETSSSVALCSLQMLPGGRHLDYSSAHVLTTSSGHFVDIRVFCENGHSELMLPNNGGPMDRLLHATAGTCTKRIQPASYAPPSHDDFARVLIRWPPVTLWAGPDPTLPGGFKNFEHVCNVRRTHWVAYDGSGFGGDVEAENDADLYFLPNGIIVERGHILQLDGELPESDQIDPTALLQLLQQAVRPQCYQCCWALDVVQPTGLFEGRREMTLRLHQYEQGTGRELARGLVVRVGWWVQGLMKIVRHTEEGQAMEEISCERWTFMYQDGPLANGGAWTRMVRLGRLYMPCHITWLEGTLLSPGQTVTYGDWEWQAVEMQEW